jgi:O-acetyl-ADP-ribose deacetylase (regulator of RNase III)
LEALLGNIATLRENAIVNAANPSLLGRLGIWYTVCAFACRSDWC